MSVFTRWRGTHLRVRTPIKLALVALLVLLLSAFCYYRVTAPTPPVAPSQVSQ